jgi:DNA-binding beta-propeller fold protein YncE
MEVTVKTSRATLVLAFILAFVIGISAQQAPLKLSHTTPVPELHDGDYDHLLADVEGHRLFATAEENSKVLVFDLKTNKLVHTISDLKAPHSLLYRADLKKLFVVDGDLGEVKIYDTESGSYKPTGSIKLREGADASGYDPSSKLFYVVNGGKDAKLPNAYISILDVDAGKVVNEIKMDSDDVEGMVFEKSGNRMFVNVRGKGTVEVFDRGSRALLATWPISQVGKNNTAIALDEGSHRLFIGTRIPAKLVVLDTESGKIVANYPAAAMVDDMAFDSQRKRIYFAGSEFFDVFQETDADHYDRTGHIATAFRAKTGVLVPELNKFYLAVPHHEKQVAELRVYDVLP